MKRSNENIDSSTTGEKSKRSGLGSTAAIHSARGGAGSGRGTFSGRGNSRGGVGRGGASFTGGKGAKTSSDDYWAAVELNNTLVKLGTASGLLAIVGQHAPDLKIFDFVNCATVLHRVAKYGATQDQVQADTNFLYLCRKISSLIENPLSRVRPRELSNIAWGLAKLEIVDRPLMALVADTTCRKIKAFNGQALATTICAFAKLNVHNRPLLTAVAGAIVDKISELNAQDLTNSVWAFAKFGYFILCVLCIWYFIHLVCFCCLFVCLSCPLLL